MDLFDIAVASKLAGGGGGGSSYTLLAEDDVVVSNPSSSGSGTLVKTLQLGASAYTSNKILYVKISIKSDYEGPHFCHSDAFCVNSEPASGGTSNTTFLQQNFNLKEDGTWYKMTSGGVSPANIASDGALAVYARAHSTYNVNGTYHIEVYALDWPDNDSPFDN